MNRLYHIYERSCKHDFTIINNSKTFKKKDIDQQIELLQDKIELIIGNVNNKRVYIDIKDRFLFIILFLTLKKIDVTVVLLPIEIAPDVFYENGIIYITDNKKHPNALHINEDLEIITGDSFSKTTLRDYDNRFDIYLFTSGSTGKSKLIGKNAGNIITEIMELYRLFTPSKKSCFYNTTPLYHIYGFLFGFMLPMYSSCSIDLTYNFSPESIADHIKENRIDFFISIPSYYRMISSLDLFSAFKKVKKMTSSSAPLSIEISKEFNNHGLPIMEIYGSTETGGIAYRTSSIDINWTLFSYVSLIKSNNNEETELIINSPAISVNYESDIGYSTGDIVQFKGDNFELLGRNTRFVKIHGKRLDLSFVSSRFIEYAYKEHNKTIKMDELHIGLINEKIFMFCEQTIEINLQSIIEGLKKYLPGYAIPRTIIFENIPRNEMGKLNKKLIQEKLESYGNK